MFLNCIKTSLYPKARRIRITIRLWYQNSKNETRRFIVLNLDFFQAEDEQSEISSNSGEVELDVHLGSGGSGAVGSGGRNEDENTRYY